MRRGLGMMCHFIVFSRWYRHLLSQRCPLQWQKCHTALQLCELLSLLNVRKPLSSFQPYSKWLIAYLFHPIVIQGTVLWRWCIKTKTLKIPSFLDGSDLGILGDRLVNCPIQDGAWGFVIPNSVIERFKNRFPIQSMSTSGGIWDCMISPGLPFELGLPWLLMHYQPRKR